MKKNQLNKIKILLEIKIIIIITNNNQWEIMLTWKTLKKHKQKNFK